MLHIGQRGGEGKTIARKFITEREHTLIDNINHELIQDFIGVEIIYYAISPEHTVAHDIYGEATVPPTQLVPVRMNGLVNYDNPMVRTTQFTLDASYTLELYLHTRELQQRSLSPSEGDFVEWNQIFFEISSVTRPQMVFGQPQHKIMTKLVCVPSRDGLFKAGGYTGKVDAVDNSHPASNKPTKLLEE